MKIPSEQDTKMSELLFLSSQKFPLIEKIPYRKRSTAIEMAHEMPILTKTSFISYLNIYNVNTLYLVVV